MQTEVMHASCCALNVDVAVGGDAMRHVGAYLRVRSCLLHAQKAGAYIRGQRCAREIIG